MSCSSIESERKTELVGFTNVINPRIKKIIDFQSRLLTPSPIHQMTQKTVDIWILSNDTAV